MVVALDIDETIARHPPFFAGVARAMLAAGHSVLIITLRQDRQSAENDLRSWGVPYSLLVVADTRSLMEHGDAWKAKVCRQYRVEVLFEDSPSIIRHVDRETVCLMAVDPDRHDLGRLE